MVVHSPDAFEAKKAAAAANRNAGGAAASGTSVPDAGVPPSVLAAGSGAQLPPVTGAAQVSPSEEADLLGDEEAITHDFSAWTDGHPPSRACLLYTSPSPRDLSTSRMPSSA